MIEQIPKNIDIAYANGEKMVSESNQTFYNFFNTSLRWLCGYNNEYIGNYILSLSNNLKKDPNNFKVLSKEIKSVLLKNSGKEFTQINFFEEATIDNLNKKYSVNNKFPVALTNNIEYKKNYYLKDFLELVNLEKDLKNSNLTSEGWSKLKIKKFFKHYKKQISFFIISPLLLNEGLIISEETVKLINSYCKKYKIPLVWDESYTCFYRTGTFFFLNQYNIKPNFISVDTNIYQDKEIHFLIINKHVSRKIKKSFDSNPRKKQAINLILLNSLFNFFEKFDIQDYVNSIGYRLKHKLRALSSNLKNRFKFKVTGILTLIELEDNNYATKLNKDLKNNNIIFYFNQNKTFIFIPPLILSSHSVDLLIQLFTNFFREGIRIQKNKPISSK